MRGEDTVDSHIRAAIQKVDDIFNSNETDLQQAITVIIRTLYAELLHRRKILIDSTIHVVQDNETQRETQRTTDSEGTTFVPRRTP